MSWLDPILFNPWEGLINQRKAQLGYMRGLAEYSGLDPIEKQYEWEPIINRYRAQQIENENRRELENMILSDQLSEKKHQQEMHKMILDTNRAIRKMHEENRLNAFKTQSQIAQQWTRALAGGGG